jgi:predicted TIM-barrel fold metal-dependent hydrolase
LPASLRDQAPKLVTADGVSSWVVEDVMPAPLPASAVTGSGYDIPGGLSAGAAFADIMPALHDPAERLKAQFTDSIDAEVLYGFPYLWDAIKQAGDAQLRLACARAYNDWLAEFCGHAPRRLAGIALVPMDDVAQAAAELQRAARLGLRGGLIWGAPPAARPYDSPEWDLLWAAAQDCALPLSLHILTGAEGSGLDGASLMKTYPSLPHRMERSLSDLIFGGALQRFPGLKIVSAENDIGWIPHFLQRLDHSYHNYRSLEAGAVIPEKPSFYFRRQVAATFQDDRVGVVTRDFVGAENLMWASDFPHSDSTWPNSRAVIARDFEGVPSADVAKITRENCARVYGIG